jgi:ribonuclease T2
MESAIISADKAHDWEIIPEPQLSESTRQRLAAAMPGVQSGLERHEWVEHGSCSGVLADIYFNRAAALAEQVNASKVRNLFSQNIGGTLSSEAIRSAFDQAFGVDAGARVTVSCEGKGGDRVISEILVSLAGDVTGTASIEDLIDAAVSTSPGCPSGLILAPNSSP